MNSDIAFTKRAENRVGNRMRERVSIRMPLRPTIGSDPHSTKYKLASFNEPMSVSTNTDAQHICYPQITQIL
jgi:hypothetical protein